MSETIYEDYVKDKIDKTKPNQKDISFNHISEYKKIAQVVK